MTELLCACCYEKEPPITLKAFLIHEDGTETETTTQAYRLKRDGKLDSSKACGKLGCWYPDASEQVFKLHAEIKA